MSTQPMTAIRLTRFSHGAGGACKLGPAELAQVLRHVPVATDPRILVDASSRDDAAVVRMAPDRAVVATVDFFTPVVDDAYDFGRIAAANALSDVYAMGATPLLALNLVGWPRDTLPYELLGEVLRGGADVARAAGAFVLGGHSIDDPEPKYGMTVIGEVHPDRIVSNAGAKPGDDLVLTKEIGTGVLTTALKRDLVSVAERGAIPGGTTRNVESLKDAVTFAPDVAAVDRVLLCDAQTSGGLLIAVAPDRCDALERAFAQPPQQAGTTFMRIGKVSAGSPGAITVTREIE